MIDIVTNDPFGVATAEIAYQTAFAAHAKISKKIDDARRAERENSPGAAIDRGADLIKAHAAFVDATSSLGFLSTAQAAAWAAVLAADARQQTARACAKWDEPFRKAIADRIEAARAIEDAATAHLEAQEKYDAASQVIWAAFSAGFPKPDLVHFDPRELPMTVNPFPQRQFRPVKQEVQLWRVFEK